MALTREWKAHVDKDFTSFNVYLQILEQGLVPSWFSVSECWLSGDEDQLLSTFTDAERVWWELKVQHKEEKKLLLGVDIYGI